MDYFRQFKSLPRQVYTLSILRVFLGIGSMVFSLVSLIMTDTLRYTPAAASIVAMCLAFVKAGGAFVGGRIADIKGRRFSCACCSFIAFLFYGLGGIVCKSWLVIPCIMFGSVGANGIAAPISALVADNAPRERSVECFSLLYLGSNLGYAIGPSIGGSLYYNHLALTFYLQAVVYLIGGILIFILIDEKYDPSVYKKKKEEAAVKIEKQPEENLFRLLWQRKMLCLYIASLSLMYICYGMITFMLPLQLKSLFGADAGARYIGNIWTINGIVIVLTTAVLLRWVKRHHQYMNCVCGNILYAIGFGMYIFVSKKSLFFLSAVIWSIGEIMISTGSGNYIASQSPEAYRGRFQSLYEIAGFVGKGVSPPLCALVMARSGYKGAWTVNVCVCAIVITVMTTVYLLNKKKESAAL